VGTRSRVAILSFAFFISAIVPWVEGTAHLADVIRANMPVWVPKKPNLIAKPSDMLGSSRKTSLYLADPQI
jgi:hypothetical protein